MRAKAWLVLGLFFAFVPAAAELSGSLATTFTLTTSFAVGNTLDLRLALPGFQIQSLSTWQGLRLSAQAFTLRGSVGNFGIQAGVVLQPLAGGQWKTWTRQELQVVASFLSFELGLGNLRLKLTLQAGPGKP